MDSLSTSGGKVTFAAAFGCQMCSFWCKTLSMSDIEFIYFDLGRVLLDFTHERGFQQIAGVSGLSVDAVRQIMVDQGLSDSYECGTLSTAEFHSEFCRQSGSSLDLDALSMAWGDIFDIMPQSIRLASSLKAAGYRIGILSNTCEAHWEFAKQRFVVLSQLFGPVVTSYEVKAMKPDPAIYEAAAKKAQTPPERIFFLDDRAENIAGAEACGWHARLFEHATQMATDLERLGLSFNR